MELSLRNGVRIFFLILIFAMWFTGNIDNWGPLMGLGLLAIFLWGRLYCGWICPVSTSIDILRPLMKKPKFPQIQEALLKGYVQAIALPGFFALLYLFIVTEFFIPFYIFMIPLVLVVTYLFGEACFHRNCMVGIIYSFFGKLARKGYQATSNCSGCGICVKDCPSQAINKVDQSIIIEHKYCLSCKKCAQVCPSGNVEYDILRNKKKSISS